MDNEQQFWYAIWRLIASAFCVVVLTIGGCKSYHHSKKTELIKTMVENGESAQAAACAVNHGVGETICGILASKVTK